MSWSSGSHLADSGTKQEKQEHSDSSSSRDCYKDFAHSLWLQILNDTLRWSCVRRCNHNDLTETIRATGMCLINNELILQIAETGFSYN
jgi:hypothetical protein